MTTHDALSTDDAIAHANSSGWYIYQLWQDGHVWGVTLRELEGSPRRNICNGKGLSPLLAIYTALANAPEEEPEVEISNAIIPDTDKVDISHISFVRQPKFNRRF